MTHKSKQPAPASKFCSWELKLKSNLRKVRIKAGYTMKQGAAGLGISVKQLEDVETKRNYGAHIDAVLIQRYCAAYTGQFAKVLATFGEIDMPHHPRVRRGSRL